MFKALTTLSLMTALLFLCAYTCNTAAANTSSGTIGLNVYSQFFALQHNIGTGFVGADYDFKQKTGWGFGFRPEYLLDRHSFSFHIEYNSRILHYYSTPTVPKPITTYHEQTFTYYCIGVGYGYTIPLNDALTMSIEIHATDRILSDAGKEPKHEYYALPYLSVNYRQMSLFCKGTTNLSINRWESESLGLIFGINYRIRSGN